VKDSHRRLALALLLLVGVALLWWLSQPPSRVEQPLPITAVDNAGTEVPAMTPLAALEYHRDIKPLLDRRCVVCHACYDAPCQLKLDTAAGILRGASKTPVYDGARLTAAAPSRLELDALLTAEWRARDFFPVLNEGDARPETNLAASLLYRMLLLKRDHPLPPGELPAQLDVSLEREMQCPSPDQFERYARRTPLGGMPFALPGLTDEEFRRIERWIAGGAPVAPAPPLPAELATRVAEWEKFLNGDSRKRQLMARYLFEHWFIADLYFDDDPAALPASGETGAAVEPRQFFQIVRSRTPPGQPIAPIATRRPYDDPEVARVWYRLQPQQGARLAKTHLPYALGAQRMARLRELFLGDDYSVPVLPGYDPELAANPFATFAAIPVRARYRFLLDDAQFFIGNFVKGPVCRGQLALNVINDRFWVLFADPDIEAVVDGSFLARESANLRLPGELDPEFNLVELATAWRGYEQQQARFLAAKAKHLHEHFGAERPVTLDLIWDGGRHNDNAALTVFRHFDSASVVKGLVGEVPKTAWVVDYSLFERIHYLLVAGFDVYGSASHQLLTRLYMDFLRMEGEYNFLHFLPLSMRDAERERWYQGLGASARDGVYRKVNRYGIDTAIEYRSDDPKREFFAMVAKRLGPALNRRYALPGVDAGRDGGIDGGGDDEYRGGWSAEARAALQQLASVRGTAASLLPEISFIRVLRKGAPDAVFTLLRDSDHSNVAVLLLEEQRRRPQRDRLTLVPGFIGAYPNRFLVVPEEELPRLVRMVRNLQNDGDYRALMRYYGVQRTDPAFWRHSDWLLRAWREAEPLGWGLFDLNRYQP
jgi:hypothetical protein